MLRDALGDGESDELLTTYRATGGLASLAVVGSAAALGLGLEVMDPLIGLAITVVILRITWRSWQTVKLYGHAA